MKKFFRLTADNLYCPARVISVFLLALFFSAALIPRSSEAYTPVINEPLVDASALFREAKISFSGNVDRECDVVITVTGAGKKVVLGKKGLIPSSYTVVDNLPGLYKVLSAGSLSGIAPDVREKLGITNDFSGLGKAANVYSWSEEEKIELAGPEGERQIQKAIAANERSGSYGVIENGIKIHDGKFEGALSIGRNEYSPRVGIQFFVIQNGSIVAQESRTVSLQGSLVSGPPDIEKEPILFAGMFFCLTVIAVIGSDDLLGRGGKAALR